MGSRRNVRILMDLGANSCSNDLRKGPQTLQSCPEGQHTLSSREYRCDALYTACLWSTTESQYSLQQVATAIGSPAFIPYLGRKSCPLGLPLNPQLIQAVDLKNAFLHARFPDKPFVNELADIESIPDC